MDVGQFPTSLEAPMASAIPAVQTKQLLRDAASLQLAPLHAAEVTLSSRLWEIVLALGVVNQLADVAHIVDATEDDVIARLETLQALGVLDVGEAVEPQAIRPGGLAELVDADAVDVDIDEYLRDRTAAPSLGAAPQEREVVPDNQEQDEDAARALAFRFLRSRGQGR